MSTNYVTRLLPADEWHRLTETDFPQILPYLGPEDISIVVVEHDGQVVGCWGVMPMIHLEGVWIHPAYRTKASVARRLVAATWAHLRTLAPRWVMTAATTDAVRTLLTRHLGAQHVPGDSYAIPMHGGEQRCPLIR